MISGLDGKEKKAAERADGQHLAPLRDNTFGFSTLSGLLCLTHYFRSSRMAAIAMDESRQPLADSITAILSPRDSPSRICCDRAPTAQMIKAFEQFNRGLYWEQHETLERVWREETDASIRNFYKGIIQVGVGFYHLTMHNFVGVMKVLAWGINYLKPYVPECYGVDVAMLVNEASVVYLEAKDLGQGRLGEISTDLLPKIHYRPSGVS